VPEEEEEGEEVYKLRKLSKYLKFSFMSILQRSGTQCSASFSPFRGFLIMTNAIKGKPQLSCHFPLDMCLSCHFLITDNKFSDFYFETSIISQ